MKKHPIEKKVLSISPDCRLVFEDKTLKLRGIKITRRKSTKEFLGKAIGKDVYIWNTENTSSRFWDEEKDDGSAYIALKGETNLNIQLIRLGFAVPDLTTHSLRDKFQRTYNSLNWVWCCKCGKKILETDAKLLSHGSWQAWYCKKCWKKRRKEPRYEPEEDTERTEGLEVLKAIEKWKRARNKNKVVEKLRKKRIRFLMFDGEIIVDKTSN